MKKRIFSIWSVLLILVVSIAVVVPGCDGAGETYDLTMAVSPLGSGTATDLTGTSPYTALTAVNITAAALGNYQFCEWTAPAGLFANANAAQTTFLMPAQNVTVTAHFVGPLDHFTCYDVVDATSLEKSVSLKDQFIELDATVKDAALFCNPTDKLHLQEPISLTSNPDHHYAIYHIYYDFEKEAVARSVEVSNQFGQNQTLSVWGPVALAVPTQKLVPGDHDQPACLDHLLLYLVEDGPYVGEVVTLNDQFPGEPDAWVGYPYFFANPVEKTDASGVTEITTEDHVVFYEIGIEEPYDYTQVLVDDQFGEQSLNLSTPAELLAVPSEKIVPPTPPLDHFKCYGIPPGPALELVMDVWDQFHEDYLYTEVMDPMMFCNPVDKVHGTVETSSNPDNHLTVYTLHGETLKDYWTVTVDNQFNDAAPQTLLVWGPVALAVPTQKVMPGEHGMPKYLDHYLLYDVVEGLNVTATVDLDDQFPGTAPGVEVTEPVYFANPAFKGYIDHVGIWDPEEHLLFYRISDNEEYYDPEIPVLVRNQFFQEEPIDYYLNSHDQLLAVPSVKVAWELYIPL